MVIVAYHWYNIPLEWCILVIVSKNDEKNGKEKKTKHNTKILEVDKNQLSINIGEHK